MDKLLAQDAEGLFFFVFLNSGPTFLGDFFKNLLLLFITLNLDEIWHRQSLVRHWLRVTTALLKMHRLHLVLLVAFSLLDLGLNGKNNSVDAAPLIAVLGLPPNDAEAL